MPAACDLLPDAYCMMPTVAALTLPCLFANKTCTWNSPVGFHNGIPQWNSGGIPPGGLPPSALATQDRGQHVSHVQTIMWRWLELQSIRNYVLMYC